ncbi:MAG: zinc-dependent metalloprotease [Candidatus Aminicenantes bacterium]|nr:MAG: zinc-dependent metalloprotease [Candidatus Aminicenantes bacterium]
MRDSKVRFTFTSLVLFRAILVPLLLTPAVGHAESQGLPTIQEKTASMESQDGFIPIHYDRRDGRLYLEVSLPGKDFLYNSFLASGAGLALDRGWPIWAAIEMVVCFERHGPRLFLIKRDSKIQSLDPGKPELERLAEESFPVYLQGSFPIVAEEGKRVLVDGTDHFIRDLYGIPGRLPGRLASRAGKKGFRLDPKQSSIYRPRTRSSPESTEIEALLAFVTDEPGTTLLVRERHSLGRLPAPGFEPRRTDPRMGFHSCTVLDLSRSSLEDRRIRYVCRWRLEKCDPASPVSDVVKPLVFFLDSAMPDDVRKAAKLGIEYWNQVFTAVGFRNAIQVRDLPTDADPLDRRFPIVVLWSPAMMSSRAPSLVDPRTGELLKAVIFLDGYQERVEANTYRAFQPALESGQPDLETAVLARRIRSVAHEAGHALASLAHNSIIPSVMGIHRPRFRVGQSGRIKMDLSLITPPTPFPYDEWMIRYAYTTFNPGEEEEGLRRIAEDGLREGLRFVPHLPESNPRATLRIHSADPMTVLKEDMAVRRVLLGRFGLDMLHPGEPTALLFERLIPIYFHHRHALRAVVKMLGGVNFTYGLKGDNQTPGRVTDSREQRQALDAILKALSPEELLIPPQAATLIPPRLELSDLEWPIREPGIFLHITGYGPPIRLPISPGKVFNPLDWARVLSDLVMSGLLDRGRLARVAVFKASGQSDLSIHEILDQIISRSWRTPIPDDPVLGHLRRTAQSAVLDSLLKLAQDDSTPPEVREPVRAELHNLLKDLRKREAKDLSERAHLDAAVRRITEIF